MPLDKGRTERRNSYRKLQRKAKVKGYEYESQNWDSEEIPATERDLAVDAPWKQIQKNTFTRWCNEHLKQANMRIGSLETDLSDGLRLIALLEVLSNKHVGRINKRPTFRQMKMENVAMALNFLENERIKLVSIDAQSIVDGNLKLILGLIWTLILYYSISMPMEGEDESMSDMTPKQRLLGWIQNKIPQLPITNFSRDWQDGRALGALVDNCAPGLCPDWQEWSNDGPKNAQHAMDKAEEFLGVPKIIAPDEITSPHVDDHSVMTYLSQFPKAQLKKEVPDTPKCEPKKVRAFGKGVEQSGNKVGEPAPFTIESIGGGSGDVLIYLVDPEGHNEELSALPNNDRNKTYSCVYHPQLPGKHRITVLFGGLDIQKSPFTVDVEDSPPKPEQVTAKGPGIDPTGNIVNKETYFEIFTTGCGIGELVVIIFDEYGDANKVIPYVTETSVDTYRVNYTPTSAAVYTIEIMFGSGHIRQSPFNVQVDLPLDSTRAWAEGIGLSATGLTVRDQATFIIHTEDAGSGQLDVKILGPNGVSEPVNILENGDGTYSCDYIPLRAGNYVATINYGGGAIPGAPFRVAVDPAADAGAVKLSGPGIKTGNFCGTETYFECDFSRAGKGMPSFEIEDPNGNKLKYTVDKVSQTVWRVRYTPDQKGDFVVSCQFAEMNIPGCPIRVEILPSFDASLVRAYGRGLQAKGVRVKEKADFYININGAGEAELKVNIIGPRGNPEPVEMHQDSTGQEYSCAYYPLREGKYVVSITFGGKATPKSPFEVMIGSVAGKQQVRAYGPGLHGGMVGHSADFVVETIGETIGQLGFSIEGPSKAQIECVDQGDGSCDVRYYPTEAGEYAVHVICDDQDIKDSPFMALVQQNDERLLAGKTNAYGPGLESGVPVVGQPAEFTVDTSGVGSADCPIKIYAKDADGNNVNMQVVDNHNGTYTCIYVPTKSIKHTIMVAVGGVNIPRSPWRIQVQEDSHPENVRVYGPGVENVGLKATEPTYFTVDCSDAGQGDVSIGIKCAPGVLGNTDVDIDFDIIKNDNDTFTVKYLPPEPGQYTIQVLFDDQQIPAAPIDITVSPNHDASKVRADGPGLQPKGVEAEKQTHFTIFARGAGKGKPGVVIANLSGQEVAQATITSTSEGSYTVQYVPVSDGSAQVHVTYGGDDIPESPFHIEIAQALNIEMVQVHSMIDSCFVREEQSFSVYTTGAGGMGQLECKIVSPSRKQVYAQLTETESGYEISFTPSEEGTYRIDINYDHMPIRGSPFHIEAQLPPDATMVKAHGPGLAKGEVGEVSPFTIDTRGAGNGSLGLTVEGPCEAKIDCIDNGNGSCSVTYLPTEPGDYQINILFADQHIPGSPFTAYVKPSFDATKVSVHGDGLEGAKVGEYSVFKVDTSRAGRADLVVEIVQADGSICKPDIQTVKGITTVKYAPTKPGQAVVTITFGGVTCNNFPRSVQVKPKVDTKSIRVSGPGVDGSPVFVDVEAMFTIDASKVAPRGGSHIDANITGPSGIPSPVRLTDEGNGIYDCRYIAYERGQHNLVITFQEVAVPRSPIAIDVTDGCDASRVKAYGPGLERGTTSHPTKFTVDTRGAGTGGLGLAIEGPSDAKIRCDDNKDGTCSVEYFPETPGEYDVIITYGGDPIPRSPFTVQVTDKVDPTKVKLSGNGISAGVRMAVESQFEIDCSKAGVAPLETTVRGPSGHVRVEVLETSSQVYTAKYVAHEIGHHEVGVRYAGQHVPNSPVKIGVLPQFEAKKVKAAGDGIGANGVPASIPVEFTIDATEAGEGHLTVRITDPEGNDKPATINNNGDGTFNVRYVPEIAGKYTIDVTYGGENIPFSPFAVKALQTGDALKCNAKGKGLGPTVTVGTESVISIDCKDAGRGKLTAYARGPHGQDVDVDVFTNNDTSYDVFFTPMDEGDYVVGIRYGGQHIRNSPFKVRAESAQMLQKGTTGSLFPANSLRPYELVLPSNVSSGVVSGLVKMPSGKTAAPEITDNNDCTATVRYQPNEKGLHEMSIYLNGQHIAGSPISFYVDAFEPGHVTAYGPGLSYGVCNQQCPFTIVTEKAGAGNLSLSCEGPSKADFTCVDNKDGTCSVSYLPTAPGEYKIIVKFDDENIPGSPYGAQITSPSVGASYGSLSEVPLKINETDLMSLTCTLQAPSGRDESCQLKQLSNGNVGIIFTPKEVGEHLIIVKKRGKQIQHSPFRVMVSQSEVGNAAKVRVYGQGVSNCVRTMQQAEFFVDTKFAGFGGLALSIEGPSKVDINCEDRDDSDCRVTYTPQEPGIYLINVKFADEHVTGSPFTVKAEGQGRIRESIVRRTKAAQVVQVGNTCDLNLRIPNMNVNYLTARVQSPSGTNTEAQIIETEDANYSIRFIPKETGVHTVIVLYNNDHVPGSPFHFTVGEVGSGGAAKVTAHGSGLERGMVNIPAEFSISTKEAGAGGLSIAVEGPSKAEINFEDRKDGSCGVSYVVTETGDYEVCVKFNEEHIEGSPFPVTIKDGSPATSNASKVRAHGPGLTAPHMGPDNEFSVDANEAGKNVLMVGISGPKSPCEEVLIKHLGDKNYNVTYTVLDRGDYVLVVKWGDEHIPGSPFHVTVP